LTWLQPFEKDSRGFQSVIVHSLPNARLARIVRRLIAILLVQLYVAGRCRLLCLVSHGRSPMRVTMISDEKALVSNVDEVVRLACEGQIVVEDFDPDARAHSQFAGPADLFPRRAAQPRENDLHQFQRRQLAAHLPQAFQSGQGRFILHTVPPVVAQVLDMLRMSMILTLARDEAEAIALARGGKA
jgi:hypothetical protein